MLALPDGSIAVCGQLGGCDYLAPGFVAVYNKNGQQKWRVIDQSPSDPANPPSYFCRALYLAPDGNILAASESSVRKFDPLSGTLLANYPQKNYRLPTDMIYLPGSDTYVITGYAGITLLSPSQNTEVLIKPATPGAEIIRLVPWKNGRFLGLNNTGVLEEFTSNGPVIRTLGYSAQAPPTLGPLRQRNQRCLESAPLGTTFRLGRPRAGGIQRRGHR